MPQAHWRYLAEIERLLRQIRENQGENLERAALILADSLQNRGMVYLFGTGHSHLLAEELFYRAGGLAAVCPILIPPLMLHQNASLGTQLERRTGYVKPVLDGYDMRPGDVFVAISNSGRNAAVAEAAEEAIARGLKLIALTSLRAILARPPRHRHRPLHEAAEVVLDNGGIPGDAALSLEGLAVPIAATSTVTGAVLLQCMAARAVELLVERGAAPELYVSSNADRGDRVNLHIIEKYRGRIPHL